jgi:hypothetical protein
MVAAWSVDRLGRSLIDLLDFLRELHAKGVDLRPIRRNGQTARDSLGRPCRHRRQWRAPAGRHKAAAVETRPIPELMARPARPLACGLHQILRDRCHSLWSG